MWPRPRKLWRTWLLIICMIILTCIFVIWSRHRQKIENKEKDYAALRLSDDQKDYIDGRGMHVVIGHYIGDSVDPLKNINITDEVLNKNMFSPLPHAGKNGEPVAIPSKDFPMMKQLFQINRFNLMASDRIPLNRTLPDMRKKRCNLRYADTSNLPNTSVIIVFHNEAWSTLLRTVHSVINRSPRHLLAEIILVDDNSERDFLKAPLEEYVAKLPVPVRILRSETRSGLVHARLLGAKQAKGEVLTFLDAHCECTVGWLEPLLTSISENKTRVVSPVIDIINDDNFSYTRSFELHWGAFNWELHFRWFAFYGDMARRRTTVEPFKTPAMAGGLFSMDRNYFFKLGSYDEQMKIWGGENLELSFRVWQCGGSVEIAPCSHVGHLFRKSSPYTFPGGVSDILYGNLARVALVWMDDWAEFFFKFNPEAERLRDKQQIKSRLTLRENLKCNNFEWYLDNIWPEHFFPKDDRFFGQIVHVETNKCLMRPFSKTTFSKPAGFAMVENCVPTSSLSQMFIMTNDGSIMSDESVCLDAPDKDTKNIRPRVKTMPCCGIMKQKWRYDENTKAFLHVPTGMCLHFSNSDEGLVIAACNHHLEQQWLRKSVPWK